MLKEIFIVLIMFAMFGIAFIMITDNGFNDRFMSNTIINTTTNTITKALDTTSDKINTITRTSISILMHNTIDPISPTFLELAENNCIAYGGYWHDTKDQVGCFNMPIDSFNARECIINPVYSLIQNSCNGLEAIWICNSENVGCYYN